MNEYPTPEQEDEIQRYEEQRIWIMKKIHSESRDCWCNPTLIYKDAQTGNEVWSHKSDEELNQ